MMVKLSKRMKQASELVQHGKAYSLDEAVSILKKSPHVKFDETVDIVINLDIDPKQTDQAVRGTTVLPHGIGKSLKVLVFCKGEAESIAKSAGAEYVGLTDFIEKINSGWLDFDVAIATPDVMREVGGLGKVLGPRGLMPSPKAGTVTNDVAKAIKEVRSGKIEFKMDKLSSIHLAIGKISFDESKIVENAAAVIEVVIKARPSSLKGRYIRSVYISTTMGPGLKVDLSNFKV